jgi:hypothetical protein
MAIDAILQLVTEIAVDVALSRKKAWRRLALVVLLVVLAIALISTLGK